MDSTKQMNSNDKQINITTQDYYKLRLVDICVEMKPNKSFEMQKEISTEVVTTRKTLSWYCLWN